MADKFEELRADVEQITWIIQPVHQREQWVVEVASLVPMEHLSSDLVENLQKAEQDVNERQKRSCKYSKFFKVNFSEM